jgi:predicted methyltransferase
MHFTVEAQNLIREHMARTKGELKRDFVAIDATAGNGFDTMFLAELFGPRGKVIAMDIQPEAIAVTRDKLRQADQLDRVELICSCHSQLYDIVHKLGVPSVDIAMFNLGYLPLGDKSIITKPSTTRTALDGAISLLDKCGIMSILSYPGHLGGSEEHRMVCDWVESLRTSIDVERFADSNNAKSPVLWILVKRQTGFTVASH